MDQLDRYGLYEHRYEGIGEVNFAEGNPLPVYFDARQLRGAEIIIGYLTEGRLGGSFLVEPRELVGKTTDGRPFRTLGDLVTVRNRSANGVNQAELFAREIDIGEPVTEGPLYYPVRFALYNFVVGRQFRFRPGDINIEGKVFRAEIVAVDNYVSRAEELKHTHEFAHTAWCEVEPLRHVDGAFPLAAAADFVDVIADALSLASGTLVTWHNLVVRDWTGKEAQIVHRAAVSKRFSSLLVSRDWSISPRETINAWFKPRDETTFSREELRLYVRQHCEATQDQPFLETRGLSAATLLDVMAGRYAELTNAESSIDPVVWKKKVFPKLREALDRSDLTVQQKGTVIESIRHQYRTMFGVRLAKLLGDLELSIDPLVLRATLNSRNKLVHAGHFYQTDSSKHISEYFRLLLLGRCVLLAAVGVENDLVNRLVLD